MKKTFIVTLLVVLLFSFNSMAQDKYFTKSGRISFFSKATMENIEAHHRSVSALLDTKTGSIQFALLMKGFEFKKALMQEHFNKSYIESDKFPKAEFKGQVVNNSEINYAVNGEYPAKVNGEITIHGQSKQIETIGTITVKDGKLLLKASFPLTVADYKITIPRIYRDNIAKSINVTVDCTLAPR